MGGGGEACVNLNFINELYFLIRLILRCRQDARNRFAQLRSDVLVKLELLDNKHIQDVVWQLQRFVSSLAYYHTQVLDLLNENKLFPIEVDLAKTALEYDCNDQVCLTAQNNFYDFEFLVYSCEGLINYLIMSSCTFLLA